MGCISKQQIQNSNDRVIKRVLVPEWSNGDAEAYVVVRSMTVKERAGYEQYWNDTYPDREKESGAKPATSEVVARMIVYTVVDDAGEPLFTVEDIPSFNDRNSAVLTRLWNAAIELNGVNAQKVQEAKAN
jgi:Phage tail assembly chaperone, TAC